MIKNSKILLTGITGRIGGAVAAALAPHNELWGLARFSDSKVRKVFDDMGVHTVQGDYSTGDFDNLPNNVDYILHLAASIFPDNAEDGLKANADGAARLMAFGKKIGIKAFLHVSTTGVYAQNPDPYYRYKETADVGGGSMGQYNPTKLAGEGAVRAAAILLDLPTIICRQNVQYGGPWTDGGLFGHHLELILADQDFPIPVAGKTNVCAPIHDDDIVAQIGPCLANASVPANIVNWCGDAAVEWIELWTYVYQLLGKNPKFVETAEFWPPTCAADGSKRAEISGPCKVQWKEGITRMIKTRHPEVAIVGNAQ